MNARQEFVSRKKEHQVFIADQNQCCLCGSKLVFKHKIDYLSLQVREDADCPTCCVRLKTKSHGLQ